MIKLNLAGVIKCNKKIYRYIRGKRKNRENVSPVWKEMGDLVTRDMKKAEVYSMTFLLWSSAVRAPTTRQEKAKVCNPVVKAQREP